METVLNFVRDEDDPTHLQTPPLTLSLIHSDAKCHQPILSVIRVSVASLIGSKVWLEWVIA